MKKWILHIILCLLIVSCSREQPKSQGYIEGRYTYMTTNVSGTLKQLFVQRGSFVKKGQVLFALDEQPENYAYEVAEQKIDEAIDARNVIISNLAYAKLTYERNKILVQKKAIQQSALDNAKTNFDAYAAQLAQANANIIQTKYQFAEAGWTLRQKKLYAPVDAQVFDTYYRLGEYTVANQAILSLLAPQDIKAIFFISEKDLGQIKLANQVSVSCDGCSKMYTGKITFISPTAEYTPPVIYSNQTSAKLIYRIEAEFTPQDAIHLHPGQPVNINYD